MIIVSAALVGVAVLLLLVGVFNDSGQTFLFGSMAASILSFVALALGVRQGRKDGATVGDDADAAPVGPIVIDEPAITAEPAARSSRAPLRAAAPTLLLDEDTEATEDDDLLTLDASDDDADAYEDDALELDAEDDDETDRATIETFERARTSSVAPRPRAATARPSTTRTASRSEATPSRSTTASRSTPRTTRSTAGGASVRSASGTSRAKTTAASGAKKATTAKPKATTAKKPAATTAKKTTSAKPKATTAKKPAATTAKKTTTSKASGTKSATSATKAAAVKRTGTSNRARRPAGEDASSSAQDL